MVRRILITSVLMSVAVAGCGHPTAPAERPKRPEISESSESTAVKSVAAEETPAAASIELTESTWADLQAFIAKQKGRIVVVDVWSTACEPCMKEFPQLITLQKKYPDDVVAVSFDVDFAGMKNKPPTYYRERVVKFLNSQGDSTVLHRMSTTAADDLFTEIKLDSIPAVYVYGRDGNLVKRFEGSSDRGDGVSYEHQIGPLVADLVKSAESTGK